MDYIVKFSKLLSPTQPQIRTLQLPDIHIRYTLGEIGNTHTEIIRETNRDPAKLFVDTL